MINPDLSHLGSFSLESQNKRRAVYQWSMSDLDSDFGTGHFTLDKRGRLSFYNETDKGSTWSRKDELLGSYDLGDNFSFSSILKDAKNSVSNLVDVFGDYGNLAATGLDTATTVANSLSDVFDGVNSITRSDNFSFDDVLDGVNKGLQITSNLTSTIAPVASLLLL